VNERLDRNITKAFNDVYNIYEKYDVNMRKASTLLAVNRVVEAIKLEDYGLSYYPPALSWIITEKD
jgi:glutamate dehydrogenase/leucine dehydrogenase